MTFEPEWAYGQISRQWDEWMSEEGIPKDTKWVVAISGGKDSTVVAALAVRKFGKENVIGVTLPCDGQKDFDDSLKVIDFLGIRHVNIDIGDSVKSILDGIENNSIELTYDTKVNLPARTRMAATFAVAQSVGGMVLCTSNLSETILGFCSVFGDDCGSYGPVKGLTATEVVELGDWLGLPRELTHKTPIDGLQPLTDEEKLGMRYSEIDKTLRTKDDPYGIREKIKDMFKRNKFKYTMVKVPYPTIPIPAYV